MPEFKKIENKKFIGWKIEEEIVLPGNVIKVSKNIDCYANYADIYKITYDVTGGTGTPEQQEKSQINNHPLHLKETGKEQINSKVHRWKQTTKIRVQINEIETKQKIEKTNKTKSLFFEKIN